ncbi:hypothetical protein ACFO0N_02820 [Halobium salinum]|uniref:Uncharacterized protein n=1 Tax=Halobium salinum TaxID=1364940 RepID=A0ABD5P7Z0_9EURY|nr:hypothetical protein [Halobium salinum]
MAGGTNRGQSTLDYAVGVSIFLVTVAGVVTFVPGMLDPFDSTQEDVGRADRLAESLAADLLVADPTEPYRLDGDCAREFFDAEGDGAGGLDCRFGTDASDLGAALHAEGSGVRVTVEGPDGVVDADFDGDGTDDGSLAAGPTPPSSGNVAVAQRAVSYDGETYRLLVSVW